LINRIPTRGVVKTDSNKDKRPRTIGQRGLIPWRIRWNFMRSLRTGSLRRTYRADLLRSRKFPTLLKLR